MTLLATSAICILIIAALKSFSLFRSVRNTQGIHLALVIFRIQGIVLATLVGLLLLGLIWTSLVFVISVIVAIIIVGFLRFLTKTVFEQRFIDRGYTIRRMMDYHAHHAARRIQVSSVILHSRIAPQGWSEVSLFKLNFDNLISIRTLGLTYILIIVVSPLGLAAGLAITFKNEPPASQAVAAAIFGYNSMLTLSTLIICATIVVAIALVLRVIDVVRFKLSLAVPARHLANHVGYGGAIGLCTAAIVPVMTLQSPLSTFTFGSGPTTGAVSPQLLIELPAWGAVAGFITGTISIATHLASNAINIVYRHTVFPLTFVAITIVLTQIGISPRSLFPRVSGTGNTYHSTEACERVSESILQFESYTPEAMAPIITSCSPDAIINDSTFITLVVLLASLGVVVNSLMAFKNVRQS